MLYPVKSLAGISVEQWPVVATGLQYDRKWMIVDSDGVFLSQRKLPKMALITTAINYDELLLSAPGMQSIAFPLTAENNVTINTKIWRDQFPALTVSNDLDKWLQDFLNRDCKLVCQSPEAQRLVDPNYGKPNDITSFADGFPFLITLEQSLAAINQTINPSQPLSMLRFRPNLVIKGGEPFIEDTWRKISIDNIKFRLPKPCSRCNITTIDPATGVSSGKEPLATLNKLRKWQNGVYFGQNALHDNQGLITMGDPIQILATGDAQPPL